MTTKTTSLSRDGLAGLCRAALSAAGASEVEADVLAAATVEAELLGVRAVGLAHLFDYLTAYAEGRISRDALPAVRRPAPAVLHVDAQGGLAQTAYAVAAEELRKAIRDAGLAALWIRNSFTCGELGWYARRLAEQDFVAVAFANSNALMSVGGASRPVLGTNPMAYGVPRPGLLPFVIDQASSSTAFVNVRRAAEAGEPIPPGWAIGPDGDPTTDANTALEGALLPFGGHRGGNVALLVEILATLSGAAFSLDAAPFDRGTESPGIGVCLLGVDPARSAGSIERLWRHLDLLADEHGVRLPALELTGLPDTVELPADVYERLRAAAIKNQERG